MEAIRPSHLSSLMAATENAITVREIASTDLWWAEPDADSAATLALMQAREYDVAPLREIPPYRFVSLEDLRDHGNGPLAEHAKPIDAAHIVSAGLGIAEGVHALAARGYYFVLDGHQLTGVVTRADIQRPAVSVVTLSLILICEAGLAQLIPLYLGSEWSARIPPERRERAEEILAQRQRHNAEMDLGDCLMIEDRLGLVAKSPDLLRALGFNSRGEFDDWSGTMARLRDVLAHAGTLLHHQPDPTAAIEVFGGVRRLARRTSELVEQRDS